MKKFLIALLSIIILLTFVACGNNKTEGTTNNPETTSDKIIETTENTKTDVTDSSYPLSPENTTTPTIVESTTNSETTENFNTSTTGSTNKETTTNPSVTTPSTQPNIQPNTQPDVPSTTHPSMIPSTQPSVETTNPQENIPENNKNNIITVNNTKMMVEIGKIISITESTDETTKNIKDVHNEIFEEVKTNINDYCTIKKVTSIVKKAETIDGVEAYFLIGFATTEQLGRTYIITTTTLDDNKPYNFTAIYSSDMSLEEILNNMEKDMDTFSNMIV